MFHFLIHKPIIQGAQAFIDRLNPKVDIQIPRDLPLPSLGIIKKMSAVVSRINAWEPQLQGSSDEELRLKTSQFKSRIQELLQSPQEELKKIEDLLETAEDPETYQQVTIQVTREREQFKKAKDQALDSILPEAFALVREAGRRVLSMRHFDIQLVGGMILHQGKIAEMATGEGKTLVATLPAYLNALTEEGVHVVTVNDYLARRDREWMGPLYEFLGLTVGVIQHDMDPFERQKAYACDITYGTNNEFGFDYLRDNMVSFKEEMVQHAHTRAGTGHAFAIVDEVDSILIDEARTPLIISGPAEESTDKYYKANTIVRGLKGRRITERDEIEAKYKNEDLSQGFDYVADEKARSIALTEEGEKKSAQLFGVENLHDMETLEFRHHILQALKAKEFFQRDVDYVVRDGKVIIVDEFTGRMMPGRRWSEGLHQAVEAKEGIKIERENQTLATITFQNYFRMYEKLSGMTGTAYTEANEFKEIYKLDCVVLPTNRILKRTNHPDCIYKTAREKFQAVVEEIEELHKKGQPVLVGTISIEKSELLSQMLKAKGIPHQVLNAKYHDQEAHIIAQAGRHKAVTIATNMAGRGTDIVLGGNAEYLAKSLVSQKTKEQSSLASVETNPQELLQKFFKQFREQVSQEHEKVVELGGLHVLGTERHESRRIDNQLRGRSGRQGDPGSSRFYVSLEDDLMRLFASERVMKIMDKLGMQEGEVIEHPWVSGAIEIAQKRVETHNFEIRKQLLEYDNVMNKQREAVYSLRRSVLESHDVKDRIRQAVEQTTRGMVQHHLAGREKDMEWNPEGLILYFKTKFGLDLGGRKAEFAADLPEDEMADLIFEELQKLYEAKEKEMTPEDLRALERILFLHTMDVKWKDHLYAMDQLKEGIGLRAYAHRDPLMEYKQEAFDMFQAMYDSIHQDVAETIFRVQPVGPSEKPKGVFSSLPQKLVHEDFSGLSSVAAAAAAAAGFSEEGENPALGSVLPQPPRESPRPPQPYHKEGPKVGRNDPCPCGSGKKYKKCCGR